MSLENDPKMMHRRAGHMTLRPKPVVAEEIHKSPQKFRSQEQQDGTQATPKAPAKQSGVKSRVPARTNLPAPTQFSIESPTPKESVGQDMSQLLKLVEELAHSTRATNSRLTMLESKMDPSRDHEEHEVKAGGGTGQSRIALPLSNEDWLNSEEFGVSDEEPEADLPKSRTPLPPLRRTVQFAPQDRAPTTQAPETTPPLDTLLRRMAEAVEGTGPGTNMRGYSAKERHRAAFERHPLGKYEAVIDSAVRETGAGNGMHDAEIMRNYFRTGVPIRDFKMLLHIFELWNALHSALDMHDEDRAKGLIAAGYQMMEQYVVDHGELTMAWPVTHLPKPKTAACTAVQQKKGEGTPIGELTPVAEWEANSRYVAELAKHKKLQRQGYKETDKDD